MALSEAEHAALLSWLQGTDDAVTAVDVAAGLSLSVDEGARLLRGLLAVHPGSVTVDRVSAPPKVGARPRH